MARVAVVTGGTRGIGLAISAELAAQGFHVAAIYASNDEAAQAAEGKVPGLKTYKWDVGAYDECVVGLKQVEADLGPVDVLVNNAGITRDATLHRMKPEQWAQVRIANYDSLFNMTRPVIEGMRARNYGRIINISSMNGQRGQIGQSNYSASKAASIGFTKALAQECASKGITVNVVCPGYIDTEILHAMPEETLARIIATIPVGRLGKAEEIAKCVAFLASEDAGFISGATLSANGAQYMG